MRPVRAKIFIEEKMPLQSRFKVEETCARMLNVLSHVLPHVLMRHTEISFHVQGVPDPLYGPWYAGTLSPSDEAEAAIAACRDASRVPGARSFVE